MGQNSFRNLTYGAVALVVVALMYLVYQASQKKKGLSTSATPSYESGNQGLSGYDPNSTTSSMYANPKDTLGLGSTPPPSDITTSSVDGKYTTTNAGTSSVDDVAITSSASKGVEETAATEETGKKTTKVATKSVKSAPKRGFDAGDGGDNMVIAGSFASRDNAVALLDKIKKMGFVKAEIVKLENNANNIVVAAYYKWHGAATGAVNTLKNDKVPAYIMKKPATIYRANK